MPFVVADLFDEYPNPVFVIRPIILNGKSEDFEYIYVNKAFSLLVGRSENELLGNRYTKVFKQPGERIWLDAFDSAAGRRKHIFVNNISDIISKKMYAEVFHIEPDMCGCIIHDFQAVSNDIELSENDKLRNRANCDYLTGFYNRFYLNELYDELSEKKNVGITFLDINNLKQTNDTNGHASGDKLIVKVADMIRSYYVDSMVFRMGGDEFLIITENLEENDFAKLSLEGRKLFSQDNLAASGYMYYKEIDDLKECIDHCDKLMYEQKRQMKMLVAG